MTSEYVWSVLTPFVHGVLVVNRWLAYIGVGTIASSCPPVLQISFDCGFERFDDLEAGRKIVEHSKQLTEFGEIARNSDVPFGYARGEGGLLASNRVEGRPGQPDANVGVIVKLIYTEMVERCAWKTDLMKELQGAGYKDLDWGSALN